MNEIITTEHLLYTYMKEGVIDTIAIDNINISIEKGDFVAVVGQNGSGKSTFAKTLNAILLPTGGKVYVSGIDTSIEDRLYDIRKTVGMVFQNPDNQIVASIVEEDVAFALENLGVEPLEIRKRVDEALKAVDMYEYRGHATYKLSGGQKQRIAIAGILAMRPACIVLDEPTAMLDPDGRNEVMNTLLTLNKEQGVTIIIITHFMNEAAMAKRVVVMDNGKVILDGKPREIFSKVELLKSVGLDVPQTAELIFLLNKQGINIDKIPLDEVECEELLIGLMEEYKCQ